MKLTVAECDDGWDILIDGKGGDFRPLRSREEAEAVADRWRKVIDDKNTRRSEGTERRRH